MPIAHVQGLDLYYERRGEGPRLLFISGTGQDLRQTPNVFDAPVAQRFEVLAYDQRGLGRSGKPEADYSMADYSCDAAALLDAVGWERALVVGASFGGMVAQELAVRFPERVEKLVLACTSPGGAGGASYPLHEIAHLPRADQGRHMLPISDTRHDAAWQAAHPEATAAMLAMRADDPWADEPGRMAGALRQLQARASHDAYDRLHQIRAPTLIAAGRYDGIARPEAQEAMAAAIPGAALRWFKGGHWFLIQDRSAWGAIGDWLAG